MTEKIQDDERPTRMAYSGNCSNPECCAIVVIAPHPESPDEVVEQIAAGPNSDPEWEEGLPDCYLCGSRIDWNGNDLLPMVVRP